MPFNLYTFTTTEATATGAKAIPVSFQAQAYLLAGTQFQIGTIVAIVAANTLLNTLPGSIPVVALPSAISAGTSFTIQIDDNIRIRRHLNLPLSARTTVATQMDYLQLSSPNSVVAVQALLAELDALDQSLATFAADAGNTALIKAGPLEWNQSQKTLTVLDRRSQLAATVARYLDLPIGGSSAGKLYRS